MICFLPDAVKRVAYWASTDGTSPETRIRVARRLWIHVVISVKGWTERIGPCVRYHGSPTGCSFAYVPQIDKAYSIDLVQVFAQGGDWDIDRMIDRSVRLYWRGDYNRYFRTFPNIRRRMDAAKSSWLDLMGHLLNARDQYPLEEWRRIVLLALADRDERLAEILDPTADLPGGGWLTRQELRRGARIYASIYRYTVSDSLITRTDLETVRAPGSDR